MRRLQGVVQPYRWGHRRAIAEVLGHQPPGHPEAEYWLGAHPKAPSRLVDGDGSELPGDLRQAIEADPVGWLGPEVAERFGELPFLVKLLAAGEPLSIQAHPNKQQAEAGFAREDVGGIDRLGPDRLFRDTNHKPELLCALTPFEAKCGLRPVEESIALFSLFEDPEVAQLIEVLGHGGQAGGSSPERVLADAVAWLLRLDDHLARPMVEAVASQAELLAGAHPRFGNELAWVPRLNQIYPGDRGVVFSLLLNHLTLEPGQALSVDAGDLHAYLSGVGVEIMANSDNVLRGGLTAKRVDVDELLAVMTCRPAVPPVQTAAGSVFRFPARVPDFALTRVSGRDGAGPVRCRVAGPEIVLATAGSFTIRWASGGHDRLGQGQAMFVVPSDGDYELEAEGIEALAWRTTVADSLGQA